MKYRQMVIKNGKLTWNEYVSMDVLNDTVNDWREREPSDARIGNPYTRGCTRDARIGNPIGEQVHARCTHWNPAGRWNMAAW